MAQAFITTYQKYYRWHEFDRRKSLRPVDKLTETLPEGDIWLIPHHIGEDEDVGGSSLAEAEATIKKMHRKQLWTTYQVDYCSDMIPKDEEQEDGGSMENALLSCGKALYAEKSQKISPPLPTARKLYGYIRPSRMYTPLTTYQNEYGRIAYNILDTNAQMSRESPQRDETKSTASTKKADVQQPKPNEKEEVLEFVPKIEKTLNAASRKALKKIQEVHPRLCICCVCQYCKRSDKNVL